MRKSLIVIAILCLILPSCGGKKAEVKKVDNPANLYVEGVAFMKKKNYDKAIESFGKVRENFPFDPIALIAQVKQADSQFEKKNYLVAAGIYEDFVNSYPEDENAAYALRRLAECYERLSPTIDRDQANTFKAVERFTFLKNRYPTSPYAKDADIRIKNLTEKLAGREVYVGEFYYKWGKYNASIIRFNYFLDKYPDAKDRDKALYYLAQNYRELQNPERAQFYADRLAKEYPKSIYAGSTKRQKKTLRAAAAGSTTTARAGGDTGAGAPPAVTPGGASASQGQGPAMSDFSYDERKVRQIDLKPVQTAASGDSATGTGLSQGNPGETGAVGNGPAPFSTATAATGQKGQGGDPGRPGVLVATVSDPKGAGEAAGTHASSDSTAGTTGAAAGGEATAAGPATEKGDVDKKAGGKEQAKKRGDKKGSLGFFSEKKPVDVVSDTMEGLEKGTIIVFKGNVIAKQVDMYLFSDVLTAYINEQTNEIDRAKAEGNVKIVKLERTATCKEAFFYNDKGEIILKGDVVVFSGNDRVSGDTVTYYINEDRVHVEGEKEKRAKAVISPK
ncbi:MAG: outer membrane protein assembly factor BamD [Syntrophorhabdales bacterium]|jgi:outer membrane protein assembly factor BamD